MLPTSFPKPSKSKQRFCTPRTNRKKQRSLPKSITHSLNSAMHLFLKKQPQHNHSKVSALTGPALSAGPFSLSWDPWPPLLTPFA
jgi:hypothetical protein